MAYEGNTLYISSLKQGDENSFINNTIVANANYSHALYISTLPSHDYRFINNSFLGNNSKTDVRGVGGDINLAKFDYNMFRGNGLDLDVNRGNFVYWYLGLNPDRSNSFTGANNVGNPLDDYLDLDLTRNDLGCHGGSYSFVNFHPIDNGKSSRVNFLKTPRVVLQGQTFSVEGISFDK